MEYPSSVRSSQSLAVITVFTALAVGSDFALAGVPNVKLVDTLVFLAAYVFGFRVGASVGVLSELIWAYLSPWGAPGAIAPFLILGEVVYAIAGTGAARVWGGGSILKSGKSFVFGGLVARCAFAWDIETNVATALVAFWPSISVGNVISTVLVGIPFMLSHEVSDFALGLIFVPVIILMVPRIAGHRLAIRPILAEEEI